MPEELFEHVSEILPKIKVTLKSVYIIMPTNDTDNFIDKSEQIRAFCEELRAYIVQADPALARKTFYATTRAVFDENEENIPFIKLSGMGV